VDEYGEFTPAPTGDTVHDYEPVASDPIDDTVAPPKSKAKKTKKRSKKRAER
jgi:hypothetical protein